MQTTEPQPRAQPTPAVVLCSGGLDSTTLLAMAQVGRRQVYALSFDYGQRHACELDCARRQAQHFGAYAHEVIDLRHMGRLVAHASALIASSELDVPHADAQLDMPTSREIPSTYVPARNTLFLSYALAWAESLGALEIWIGANALDYSGYPDCRPAFLRSWEQSAALATKVGVQDQPIELVAPLLDLHKHEIVTRGHALGVDYADTVSCYDPNVLEAGEVVACGQCESCELRRAGFERASVADPTRYRA